MPPRKRKYKPADPESDAGSDGEEEAGLPRLRRRHKDDAAPGAGRLVSTYFQHHAAAGSSRTLADLHLDGWEGEGEGMRDLLAKLTPPHAAEKAAAGARHAAQFGRWWAQLRAGNSLLLYGFGSKHDLLTRFAREQTADGACFTANGLHPRLTAKQVALWAVSTLKGGKPGDYRGNSGEALVQLVGGDTRHLYIILHNIDGPGLRDHSAQRLLSELAALPNVHLAASVDHANAALLWDLQTRDRFSWVCHNVTNYAPYLREVGFAAIQSLLVGRSEQCSKQSATVVLASLSRSAREVFRLIADAQMDGTGEQGVTFQRLFQSCRERFLVSNEMLLKSFLAEFKDHELLGSKRAADGSDLLYVPLPEEALQQVLAEVDAMS